MDIRIFDYYENSDYNKLLDFNNKTHIFKEIVPAEYMEYYDASACTITNQGSRIELKSRKATTFQYDTLFIEDTKLNIIVDYMIYNDLPLYINFMEDGNTVIFNLNFSKWKNRPDYKKQRTYSPSYESWEYQGKNYLPISEAFIYDKEGKLLQKPC